MSELSHYTSFQLEYSEILASLVAQSVKNLPVMQETEFNSWVKKIPWRRKWQPTPVFWPGESRGRGAGKL